MQEPQEPPQPLDAYPYGQPPAPTADERSMAMLCHLPPIVTGFLGPLVIWLVKKDQSPFVNHHGRESLNFQITLFLVLMVLAGLTLILMFILIGLLLLPVLILVPIAAIVLQILACVAADKGQWYRYPCCLRLV